MRGRERDRAVHRQRALERIAPRTSSRGPPPSRSPRSSSCSPPIRWPPRPSATREPCVDDHIADSLVALELSPVRDASTVADLGSGAGFPGLPLAIALPEALVCAGREHRAQSRVHRPRRAGGGVPNLSVIAARAEAWDDGLGRFDLVTARALAPLDVVAEYAAPLLRVGGALVAWRGRRDPEGEAAAARAADRLGLAIGEVRLVHPYPAAEHRHLHVLAKIAPTPPEFPRRLGVARKRPLGGMPIVDPI